MTATTYGTRNPIVTPVAGLYVGTTSGTVAAGDDSRFRDAYDTVADMVAATDHSIGDTVRVQNYSATCLSGEITFEAVAVGSGYTIFGEAFEKGIGVDWKPIFGEYNVIKAAAFGVGGGLGDDSARLKKANLYLAYTRPGGGGVISHVGTIHLESTIILGEGVVLRGGMSVGLGDRVKELPKQNSVINVAPGVPLGINLSKGSSVEGFVIKPSNVFSPQTVDDVANWTGTAISGNASGCGVNNCVIAGFQRGVDIVEAPIFKSGRLNIYNCVIDCWNGVMVENSGDIDRFEGVHCWPIMSPEIADIEDLRRPGIGIHIKGGVNWGKLQSCFSYCYLENYRLESVTGVTLANCGSDGPQLPGGIGVNVIGDSTAISLINVEFGGSYTYGLVVDMSSFDARNHVAITGGSFGGAAATYQIDIRNAGGVKISGNVTHSGSCAINFENDCGVKALVSGNQFFSPIGSFYRNGSAGFTSNNIVFSGNATIGNPTNIWENASNTLPSQVAASAMRFLRNKSLINVTGGTTITSFKEDETGRRVTLIFAAGTTVNNTASIKLKTGANTTYLAGSRATFECMGSVWYEL